MAIYHRDVEQRSEAWDILRNGIPTSSEFKKIVTPTGKLSTQADGYMDQLLACWMFGGPLEDPETQFRSEWMSRGVFLEAQARTAYEFVTEANVEPVGFITTDDGLVGSSTDGLVDTDGILEIKVPSPKVHAHYMRTNSIELEYTPQLQGELWVCERQWVDLVSYCPPFPSVIIRVNRDDDYIAKLSAAMAEFVSKLVAAREFLKEHYPTLPCQQREAQSV
jgi:hypothetical protein